MRNTTHMPPTQNYICINATTAEAIQASTLLSLFESENEVFRTRKQLQQQNNITKSNITDYMMELSICSLEDICGFGGFANEKAPDQAFRFLTPLFVHSGLLHWGLNMVALVSLGFKLERLMSGWRFGGKQRLHCLPCFFLIFIITKVKLYYIIYSCLCCFRYFWKCFWGKFCTSYNT